MPFDGIPPTVRHTRASALALYASAASVADLASAAHALAAVLATPAKRSQVAPAADGLTAGAIVAALRLVLRAMAGRTPIHVLACVMIEADGQRLTLRGTDLDNDLTVWIPAHGMKLAPALIPARDVLAIVAKLPKDSRVELGTERGPDFTRTEGDGSRRTERTVFQTSLVILAESGASWTIKGEWPGDYPSMGRGRGDPQVIRGDAAVILAALDFVAPAISTEETRYYLNGVGVRTFDRTLSFVTTDGRRLNRHDLPDVEAPRPFRTAIIPRVAAELIRRLLAGITGEVSLTLTESTVAMELPAARIVAKLIDGSFPDVARVIPEAPPVGIQIDRAALVAAVSDVGAIMNRDMERLIRLTFGGGECHLSAKRADGATAERAIPCDFKGNGFQVGINARYVREALANLSGAVVTLGFSGEWTKTWTCLDPVKFTDGDARRLCIIMPARA